MPMKMFLYQLYTGDEIVEWVDKLNAEEDMPVTISQLRRYLRGILNSKDYIRSITIITESGLEVTYGCIATTTYANSWIENFSYSTEELYEEISSDNKLHVFFLRNMETRSLTRIITCSIWQIELLITVILINRLEL